MEAGRGAVEDEEEEDGEAPVSLPPAAKKSAAAARKSPAESQPIPQIEAHPQRQETVRPAAKAKSAPNPRFMWWRRANRPRCTSWPSRPKRRHPSTNRAPTIPPSLLLIMLPPMLQLMLIAGGKKALPMKAAPAKVAAAKPVPSKSVPAKTVRRPAVKPASAKPAVKGSVQSKKTAAKAPAKVHKKPEPAKKPQPAKKAAPARKHR